MACAADPHDLETIGIEGRGQQLTIAERTRDDRSSRRAAASHRRSRSPFAGRDHQRLDAPLIARRSTQTAAVLPARQERRLRMKRVTLGIRPASSTESRAPPDRCDLPEGPLSNEDDPIVLTPGGTVQKVRAVGHRRHEAVSERDRPDHAGVRDDPNASVRRVRRSDTWRCRILAAGRPRTGRASAGTPVECRPGHRRTRRVHRQARRQQSDSTRTARRPSAASAPIA